MKVPDDVLTLFRDNAPSADTPRIAIRALTDVYGNLGETYVLGTDDTVVLVSRRLGDEYLAMAIPFANIHELAVEDERPFAYLRLRADAGQTRLKCAGHDRDHLNQLTTLISAGDEERPQPDTIRGESAPTDVCFQPLVGFCAALHALVQADSHICEREMINLDLIVGNPEMLAAGLSYWQHHGTNALVDELDVRLNRDQKRCLIANLLEVAMVDGTLRKSEKEMLKIIRDGLHIAPTDFDTVFNTLMIKNDLTVFDDHAGQSEN